MKRPLIAFSFTVVLLIACAQTTPTIQPTNTATATPIAPTLTPLPTISPTPTPIVPTWSPYQPDDAAGWCWQEVVGHVKYLNDVSFWDARTGWAVGERGAILHTSDGGQTWQWQNGPVTATLQHVDFVSPQTGWILGTYRYRRGPDVVLLKTDDGGSTWIEQPIPSYSGFDYPTDMTWPDARTGWLTIDRQVFHTSDGGQTWQESTLPGRAHWWDSLVSADSQHAWIADDTDIVARTKDGGTTWTTHQITATLLTDTFFLTDLTFVDPQNGWAVSRSDILHTVDGGQTWEVQFTLDWEDRGYRLQISFKDTQTGWVWNSGGDLWSTADGGLTWEKRALPRTRYAIAFVDEQNIWAVGSWSEKERSTIAHTVDGGATWEMQDTHIEIPELAYVAAARLTTYASQHNAPLEGLLPLLFPGPCGIQDYPWLSRAIHNLGWVEGTRWEAPPLPTDAGYQNMSDTFQRLDADLDKDGEDEVIILGGGCDFELVAGVLDWDGTLWQATWTIYPYTRYNSDIRARVDDFDADGHPELLVETLTHPGSGTGILVQRWNAYLVRCTHLDCQTIWTEKVGSIGRAWGWLHLNYGWHGSDYRFTKPDGVTPAILVQTHGVDFRQTPITTDTVTSTLTVLTSTQSIYLWDGAVYTPTGSTILTPAYTVDMDPITATLSDGAYAVQSWEANPDGLWQTLSIYDGDAISPTQVFTAAFTGAPGAGVWLQDIDGDGQFEVKECDTGFDLVFVLQFTERTSTLPECTIYQWDPSTRKFRP